MGLCRVQHNCLLMSRRGLMRTQQHHLSYTSLFVGNSAETPQILREDVPSISLKLRTMSEPGSALATWLASQRPPLKLTRAEGQSWAPQEATGTGSNHGQVRISVTQVNPKLKHPSPSSSPSLPLCPLCMYWAPTPTFQGCPLGQDDLVLPQTG